MSRPDRPDTISAVEIRIRLDQLDPPAGWLWEAGEPEVGFAGWLELLSAMERMIGSSGEPSTER